MGNTYKLKKIILKNTKFNSDMQECFAYLPGVEEIILDGADTSKATTMRYTFNNAKSLKSLDLSSFDFSLVPDDKFFSAFSNLTISTIYVKDQATADRLNALSIYDKPETLTFVVK